MRTYTLSPLTVSCLFFPTTPPYTRTAIAYRQQQLEGVWACRTGRASSDRWPATTAAEARQSLRRHHHQRVRTRTRARAPWRRTRRCTRWASSSPASARARSPAASSSPTPAASRSGCSTAACRRWSPSPRPASAHTWRPGTGGWPACSCPSTTSAPPASATSSARRPPPSSSAAASRSGRCKYGERTLPRRSAKIWCQQQELPC